MKYAHIARAVEETPWAIVPSKLDEIVAILSFHMEGGKFTAAELEARLGARASTTGAAKHGSVAVIRMQGVIAHRMGGMSEISGGVSTERISSLLRQALADDSVAAIVLDVDSPGGTITGVTELANEIFASRKEQGGRKPIVAHVNALAASAAYWIASAADEVVSTPSGDVGSIGVITAHIDRSKAEEAEGITRTVISAGTYKAEGWGPLTDEAKAAVQERVNDAYAVMTKDIARGRGVKASDVRDGFGQGRLVSALKGKELGMVDRIESLSETIARLTGRKGSETALRGEVVERQYSGF